jgi:electron transfer flavoprotein beta subunit
MLTRQFVPEVQGNCEFLQGEPAEVANELIQRLEADSVL